MTATMNTPTASSNALNPNDIINIAVVGTHGKSRLQQDVAGTFNGKGEALNPDGKPNGLPGLVIDATGATPAPTIDPTEFAAAAAKGHDELDAYLLAVASQVDTWKKSSTGGTIQERIAKAVQQYCVTQHGFLPDDGDGFVLNTENLDVKSHALEDRTMWLVTGTAVFGANCAS